MADYFVYALIALNAGASAAYFVQGDRWKALYWFAASVLNFCVLKKLNG